MNLNSRPKHHTGKTALLLAMLSGLNGCSYLISSATEDYSRRLKQAILDQNDPETVADALPTYILMQEASILADADNDSLLFSTSSLYGAYLNLIPDNEPRKKRLSQKGLDFAFRGICTHDSQWCGIQHKPFDEFQLLLQQSNRDDLESLYDLATAWAAWIENNKSDWNAIAQLAQVKAIFQRLLDLDESYREGEAHVYMGVMEGLLPESLGGKPDIAQKHFQRAMELSPANLLIKVLYARNYARMVFDRDLHDKLLDSTLNSKTEAPGLTLINTLAQQQARQLLNSADDYF
ncbi:MAG: TRAP transporter TatT component family protein [Gammaproteobacteria bacterium]